ncbi:MAG: alpha/beta hydrolase [Ilumatobacteraceae bacterium]
MGNDLRTHRITANGINLHVVESGPSDGPVVLCNHGFPESWYSWRHQLAALGDAGYRVLAPDMRGYGRTSKPTDPHAYSTVHVVGDLIGILDALDVDQAVIVGHDWGTPPTWAAAQLRPDRFRAIAALGVPFAPPGEVATTEGMKAGMGDTWFYFLHFQEPGRAEAELEGAVEPFLRGFFHSLSGDSPRRPFEALAGGTRPGTVFEHLSQPDAQPAWMTDEDLAFYVGEFERTGFRGGLSWYRSADTTWALSGAFNGVKVNQPALFVYGELEPVLDMMPEALDTMAQFVPNLRPPIMLPGCGHWTQQERPAEVNAALLDFLGSL